MIETSSSACVTVVLSAIFFFHLTSQRKISITILGIKGEKKDVDNAGRSYISNTLFSNHDGY